MSNILVVYSTSEHRFPGRNLDYYISALNSILAQDWDNNLHVAYSGFCNSPKTKKKIQDEFGFDLSYYFTDQSPLPINITFNRVIQLCTEANGGKPYDAIIYIDSGCHFGSNNGVLKAMWDVYKSGQYGMVAVNTSEDNGESFWGLNYAGKRVILPVGKTVNLHCQLFDGQIYQTFDNRVMPDIFASYCTESVFGTLAYSLNKHFIMLGDIVIQHKHGMDFGSSSVDEARKELLKKEGRSWSHLFTKKRTIDDIINNPEMRACGAFYEAVQNVALPNMDCYKDGLCKDPERLKRFVKENFFLTKDEFDYEGIAEEFIV